MREHGDKAEAVHVSQHWKRITGGTHRKGTLFQMGNSGKYCYFTWVTQTDARARLFLFSAFDFHSRERHFSWIEEYQRWIEAGGRKDFVMTARPSANSEVVIKRINCHNGRRKSGKLGGVRGASVGGEDNPQ